VASASRHVLTEACAQLKPDAVKLLLEAGADATTFKSKVNLEFFEFDTITTVENKIDILNMLLHAGNRTVFFPTADVDTVLDADTDELSLLPFLKSIHAIRAVTRRNPALLHSCNRFGQTPLAFVVTDYEYPASTVKELIDLGVDVNRDPRVMQKLGRLVTDASARAREVSRMLYSAGLDPTRYDHKGYTLLMVMFLVTRISDLIQKAYISDICDAIMSRPSLRVHTVVNDDVVGIAAVVGTEPYARSGNKRQRKC
jgi:hypothetical protein